jgi:predicted alpha/beta hydrolase family esterase
MNYLNVPGLYNSGAQHWQTRWEQLHAGSFVRVQQQDWAFPSKDVWVNTLNETIKELDTPTILVAHSLGCITAVHWAAMHYSPFISGALLVAPADVESASKEILKTFSPVPIRKLDFPTIVVASMNDPYCAMQRAAKWAAYWGGRFVSVGNKGHINTDSGLGDWEEGLSLLRELARMAENKRYSYACY